MEAYASEVNMPENQFYRLNKSRLFKTTKINMECPRRVEYYGGSRWIDIFACGCTQVENVGTYNLVCKSLCTCSAIR